MNKISLLIIVLSFSATTFGQIHEEDFKLLTAAYNGNQNQVIEAIINKANIDAETEKGVTALIYASQRGYDDIVKILIYNGADINHAANDGVNAILAAAMFNHINIVNYLIDKGAFVDSQNNSGIGLLHYCAAYNYDSLCKLLLSKNINIELKDNEGNTAIMIASYTGNINIVSLLSKAGAKIDNPDNMNYTPLMASIQNGYLNIAEFFLSQNSNVQAVNFNNCNSAGIAVLTGHYSIIPLLANKIPPKDTSATNPFRIAFAKNDRTAITKLKKSGLKPTDKILFSHLFSLTGLNLNNDHLLLNLKFGFHEIVNNFELFAEYQTRLFRKRIFVIETPFLQYQYWESRSFVGIGISKNSNPFGTTKKNVAFIQTVFSYSYGNYRASYKKAEKYFVIMPAAGIKFYIDNSANIQFVISYVSYLPGQIFPLHLGINLQSYFPLKNKKIPDINNFKLKTINWLY